MKKSSKNMEPRVVAVGLDLGDRWSHWCALDGGGEVAGRGRVATTAEAMAEQGSRWTGVRVAIENGTHSGLGEPGAACGGLRGGGGQPIALAGHGPLQQERSERCRGAGAGGARGPGVVVPDHAPACRGAERPGRDPGTGAVGQGAYATGEHGAGAWSRAWERDCLRRMRRISPRPGRRCRSPCARLWTRCTGRWGPSTRRSTRWTNRLPRCRKNATRRPSVCAGVPGIGPGDGAFAMC